MACVTREHVKRHAIETGSLNNEEDVYLIERVANGDFEAFDRLSAKYHLMMKHLALKHSVSADIAEDVVVESLLRVYRSAKTFRAESQFSTWLSQIVINCARDVYRRDYKRAHMEISESSCDSAHDLVDPRWETPFTEVAVNQIKGNLLESLIQKMDRVKRDLFLLNYRDSKTHEEIAEQLHLPIGTVKSRIFRAKSELRLGLNHTLCCNRFNRSSSRINNEGNRTGERQLR